MEPSAVQEGETDQDQGDEITVVGGKTQSQDTFLDAFRSTLETKKKDLASLFRQLKGKPNNQKIKELISQDQADIKDLEDAIQRIKEGTFCGK